MKIDEVISLEQSTRVVLWRSKVSYRLPDAVLISNSTESSDISRNFRKLYKYKCLAFLPCLFPREHHSRSTHETYNVSINLNIAQSAFCIQIVERSLQALFPFFSFQNPPNPPTPRESLLAGYLKINLE